MSRITNYNLADLELIENHKATLKEIADKYGVSVNAIRCALYNRRMRVRARKVLIKTPYQTKVCKSIAEASRELGISYLTILKALKNGSDSVMLLKDMEIEVKYL